MNSKVLMIHKRNIPLCLNTGKEVFTYKQNGKGLNTSVDKDTKNTYTSKE